MQAQETILFLAVAALALALIVGLVAPRVRTENRTSRPRERGRQRADARNSLEEPSRDQQPPRDGEEDSSVDGTAETASQRRRLPGRAAPASGAGSSLSPPASAAAAVAPSTARSPVAATARSRSATAAPPPAPPVAHLVCPTCRRQYAAGLRYCPYDARVLTADFHPGGRPPSAAASKANAGKICPSCSGRYDTTALVCGRDGTALVSVN